MRKFNVLQRSRKVLGAALFSGLLGVCGIGPAQAVIYTGAWDPAFGLFFPELGWRGEAKFFVPDTCDTDSGWKLNAFSCSGMEILSAEVDFYKLSDPNNTAFQETLLFDIPGVVVAMEFDDGLPTAVLGGFGYFRESTLSIAGNGDAEFKLQFWGDLARMFFVYDPDEGRTKYGFSNIDPREGGLPFITFSVVPEPESLLLVLASLSALGLLVRQRRVN
jgi:hypothetical protein